MAVAKIAISLEKDILRLMRYEWSSEKNGALKRERNISLVC